MKSVYADGINHRFRAIRKRLGLTQAQIGDILSITPGYYSKLENGDKPVKESTAILVCKAFDVRMEYLVDGVEPMFNTDDQRKRQLLALVDELSEPCKDLLIHQLEYHLKVSKEK